MSSKLIFITGVSTGLGRAFAQEALAAGHRVVGTVRKQDAVAAFEELKPGSAFARVIDVTEEERLPALVAEIESQIGPIDVLINNAGYGHEGLLEETSLAEFRQQFDVNVFGVIAITQAVLPYMRQRRRGHILNITSMGGLITFPGITAYNGSKFALEGISSSLGKEVRHLGIFVTAVEPGMFRTDWGGRSLQRTDRSDPSRHIADYDEFFAPITAGRAARSGNQTGDPVKAAQAVLKLIESPNPPAHLLLGPDALKLVNQGIGELQQEIREWESVTTSTDFD